MQRNGVLFYFSPLTRNPLSILGGLQQATFKAGVGAAETKGVILHCPTGSQVSQAGCLLLAGGIWEILDVIPGELIFVRIVHEQRALNPFSG